MIEPNSITTGRVHCPVIAIYDLVVLVISRLYFRRPQIFTPFPTPPVVSGELKCTVLYLQARYSELCAAPRSARRSQKCCQVAMVRDIAAALVMRLSVHREN